MFRLCVALAVATSFVSPVFSEDRPVPTLNGWGEAVDPDGDCQFRLNNEKLTVAVPGTKHDLCAENEEMNAPRVVRNLSGDFIAQVKVSGNVRHAGQRTSDSSLAYHGAGLLLWLNGQTYVRLERAAIVREDGKAFHYANFEIRKAGKLDPEDSRGMEIPDKDTYLRLERRNGRVFGSVSEDGVQWTSFDSFTVEIPKEIKLGVAAISTSTEPFKAEFSGLEVYKKEEQEKAR